LLARTARRRKQPMRETAEVPELQLVDDRERVLIEAVVALARSLRDERDRLAERLREVETELQTLSIRLEPRRHEPSMLAAAQ
jgi:hypothetical protein